MFANIIQLAFRNRVAYYPAYELIKTETPSASEIIDRIGGTAAVAELCEVKSPSVSEWRHKGIPKARLQFLRLARPDVFRTNA